MTTKTTEQLVEEYAKKWELDMGQFSGYTAIHFKSGLDSQQPIINQLIAECEKLRGISEKCVKAALEKAIGICSLEDSLKTSYHTSREDERHRCRQLISCLSPSEIVKEVAG